MSLEKPVFILMLLALVSADNVYLRCDADPEIPVCYFSSSGMPGNDFGHHLAGIEYIPDGPTDVWVFDLEAGTPENPKATIEEVFKYRRVDVHALFDNTADLIHDLGDCEKWYFGSSKLGVFGYLELSKFVQEDPNKSFSTYVPQHVLVCHNDIGLVWKPKDFKDLCPNNKVQRYSFRDGPTHEAAPGPFDPDTNTVTHNTMGYFNIFYVQGCGSGSSAGDDPTGGIYLIQDFDPHSLNGQFLLTHTQVPEHSIKLLEGAENIVPASSGITEPEAVYLLKRVEVAKDDNLDGSPVVTKLIFKTLGEPVEEAQVHGNEAVIFNPAIPVPHIRI